MEGIAIDQAVSAEKMHYDCEKSIQVKDRNSEFCSEKKELPLLYVERANCCGCSACFSICPVSAIYMCADKEGFRYPVVIEEKCLCCYQCIDVCPMK